MRISFGIAVSLAFIPVITTAQGVRPVAEQLVSATLPLPKDMRGDAGVLGYKIAGKLETLRASKNGMICLANEPDAKQFHVACYHESMEPFMARGREIREKGTIGPQVDTIRFAEVKSGKIKMPTQPASLYQMTGPLNDFNPATGLAPNSKPNYVVYIPFATAATTGLSAKSEGGKPWIMFPGTPKAHIMITGTM
ncbi:MAG: hypothetical protein M3Y64_09850 [Gemmatimonadota bacterium]|nr:hypothetical protein [Gemmatimonadota bacterium]